MKAIARQGVVWALLAMLALPVVVHAQYAYTTNSDNTIAITGYTGGGAATIPSSINGLLVTSIGTDVFYNCTGLTSVTVPNSVTNIGDYAFYSCARLANIYFLGNAPSLGSAVFSHTPAMVYYLSEAAGWKAIYGGLPTTPMGYAYSDNGDGTCTITGYTIINAPLPLIPSTINGLTVTSIGNNAFQLGANPTSVTIGNSVTNIGANAFAGCMSITNVTIGNSVANIEAGAFAGCTSLPHVAIPNSVTSIGSQAFRSCTSLTNVTTGNSVISIGDAAFMGCTSLTNVVIPPSVTSIGNGTFSGCTSLTHVTIPNNITTIGGQAFDFCTSLTSVTVPSSVTNIGYGIFENCTSLTGIYFYGPPPVFGTTPFYGDASLTIYYLPGTIGWGSTYGGCQTKPNPNYYLLAINSGTGGGYYTNGQIVTIAAAAASSGYSFACWTGATQYLASITTPNTTVTMPSSNIAVSATYYLENPIFTVVSEYGSPMPSVGSNSNVYDTMLTCSVNSLVTAGTTQYVCTGWSMTGNEPGYGTATNFSLTLTNNAMLTWQWQTQYWLASSTSGGGTITSGGWFNAGSNVTLTATPATNWSFAGWLGDTNMAVIVGNVMTASMTQARSIVAIFVPFTFTSTGSAINITTYTGSGGIVTIPSMINNLPVTRIGNGAFYNCTTLTNVTIPNTVTNIGGSAFAYCTSLTSIYFQGNAPSLGSDVFDNDPATVYYLFGTTGWSSIYGGLPTALLNPPPPSLSYTYTTNSDNTITITGYTGAGGAITIPSTIDGLPVTSIGNGAFKNCTLTSVAIPDSVTSIGFGAFSGCRQMTNVTIPNSITSIGIFAFQECVALTNVTIPNSVTSINYWAFSGCTSLTTVTIPNSVTSIGERAFIGCTSLICINFQGNAPTITSVFLGDDVLANAPAIAYYLPNTTGWGAAYGGLPTVPMGYAYTNNGDGTCTITGYTGSGGDISIPSTIDGLSVANIGNGAFYNCTTLTNVMIPNTVTNIGIGAFEDCSSLVNITLPTAITSVGDCVFWHCGLTNLTIPNSVTSIGTAAFSGCTNLTSLTIPDNVISIGQFAFWRCTSLTNVVIGNGVVTIGDCAFEYCALISATIGANVSALGECVFASCCNLGNVYFTGNAPSVNMTSTAPPPIGVLPPYGASPWSVYLPMWINRPPIRTFNTGPFYGDSSVVVYYQIGTQGWTEPTWAGVPCAQGMQNGFYYVSDGTNMTIVGYSGPPNATLTIPSTLLGQPVTGIGDYAFNSCTNLISITIPASVTNIGSEVFIACSSLTEITVDAANAAYSSAGGVLFDKTQTTLLEYPEGLSGGYTIPGSVTTIGGNAFCYCLNLTSVTIPASVAKIGDGAFYACGELTDVYFEGNAPIIGSSVFISATVSVGFPPMIYTDPAIVYYQSGTTGWGAFFGYLPTVPVGYAWADNGDGTCAITGYTGSNTVVSIPSTINGLTVTSFADNDFNYQSAFSNCTSITIPNSVTSIGSYAFSECYSLTSVTIPNSVTSIGTGAFGGCTSLTHVTIPNSVTSIGDLAFCDCINMTSIYFQGNAPILGWDPYSEPYVFFFDPVTVYYLPGTMGWSSTFGGLPSVTWNPQMLNDATFGAQTNCFGFTITNAGNPTVVIEACTNLNNPVWVPVATNTLTGGASYFSDSQWTNYPTRYYRLASPW